jgi:hypothetical protein
MFGLKIYPLATLLGVRNQISITLNGYCWLKDFIHLSGLQSKKEKNNVLSNSWPCQCYKTILRKLEVSSTY